ncbi:unnamed protein product [Acanthoscelides obtectus]|nr:unnamed protein product [Acanthoscelides obtectus]CAK1664265.1 Ribonuclease Z, mitochondrial [Acanthoscelides obtectus]
MPKEPKHIAEAQQQRKKIKERISKYVPGKVTLQVLGSGARGAPRALYMFSDQSRYLFNCGEGTQRLAHEHKMKLARLEHIFITQPVWKNIGGLPGTALTIQDVGVPEITLHGPPGLDEIFGATKRFVVIRDLKIHMAQCKESDEFSDNVMSVKYVPLTMSAEDIYNVDDTIPEDGEKSKDSEVNAIADQLDATTSTRRCRSRKGRSRSSSRNALQSEDIVQDDTDYYAHERKRKRRHRTRSRTPDRSRSHSLDSGSTQSSGVISSDSQQILQETKEKGVSMCYICRLQPRPGALNLDRCVKMGVPPGPLLGKLKSGEDVTLKDGTVVCSKDVCEPDDPGPIFIVVDCPAVDYIDSLLNNESLKQHQRFAKSDDCVASLVVHFTAKEVMEHPSYKKWVDEFPPSTQHLVLNESNTCMGSLAVHRIQYKLNLLSEDMFPLLGDRGTPTVNEVPGLHVNKKQKFENGIENKDAINNTQNDLENLSVQSRPTSPSEPYIFPNTFCSIHLRPNKGVDRSLSLKLNPHEFISETMEVENFSSVLQTLKQTLYQHRKNLNIREYPKILFLGTGSCIPNKTRNTSGILLATSDTQNMLLDCGEGTYGQLVRFFGPDNVDEILININAVYISHLHADHHIGLIGFLQGRRRALDRLDVDRGPVYLFAPKQIMAWLSFYDRCFENIRNEFVLVPNGELLYNNHSMSETTNSLILHEIGLKDIKTCYVRHCPNAFGLSIISLDGHKLTYSGDTMPANSLVELGQNSDVLIHEATMEDELAHEAIIKMHSTTTQAIEIGQKMKAKNILLTHFSQRYAKLPRFNDNFAENVGIAFDNMQVKLDELQLLPLLYPALKTMFAEHCEELEHKAVKRQLKLERERSLSRDRHAKQKMST